MDQRWKGGPQGLQKAYRHLSCEEGTLCSHCPGSGAKGPTTPHNMRVMSRGLACQAVAEGPGWDLCSGSPSPTDDPAYEMASTMASPMRMEQTAWSSR